ncbi:MAG: caspase family protein [Hyphomicrobiaceae bacterium]
MSRAITGVLILVLGLITGTVGAAGESRIALIIANGAYQSTAPLKNPVNDGKLMAETLGAMGFKVTLATDLDGKAMKRAMLDFGRALRASDSVGLFYYAGHAIQVAGENYLIPVDANLQDETEIGIEGVDVNDFLATMNQAQSRIKIVVLDACRNNPFPATSRSGTRGLAVVQAPTGTLIAYSTSPGEVALDGTGDNSPYAVSLAKAIKTETGKPIELVFRRARVAVLEATEGLQTPWDLSSITGDFVLAQDGGAAGEAADQPEADASGQPSASTSATADSANAAAKDYAVWVAIESSGNEAAYRAYLEEFPSGRFAAEAQKRLAAAQEAKAQKQAALEAETQAAEQVQAQSEPAREIARLFPDSSKRKLSADELYGLSCDQLWVARNEIFDRRGYCFTSGKGQSYFDNSDCTGASQSILSKTEKANVSTIKDVEAAQGCQ